MNLPQQQADKSAVLAQLRAVLAEKYPQHSAKEGQRFVVKTAEGQPMAELRQGVVTEVCGSVGSGGLFMDAFYRSAGEERQIGALVDAMGAWDWSGAPVEGEPYSERLLWVWCQGVAQAVRVTDLLLRDGNLPWVMLDLQMVPWNELRRVPASTWYRFQRIMEQSSAVFLVMTSRPIISSAAERIFLHNRWQLDAMRQPREALRVTVERVQRGLFRGDELRRIA